jgi:hypothetical protein
MSETLSFEITYLYEDSVEGIAIPVTLISGSGIYRAADKVDSGSEVCLFSREAGEQLGLDIESGIPKPLGSLTGSLDSFGHEVTIQTLGIVMDSVIYFAKNPGLRRNILGRLGWIRNLQIGLRDYENRLFVSEY